MPSGERKQDEIARHLMDAAIKYAASRGYRIGDGAQMHMQDMMVKAARRITYRAGRLPAKLPGAVGARSQVELVEQLIQQSERQVHTLIDVMIVSSGAIPGYAQDRPGVIGERTFFAALTSLCPLWPFC